MNLQNFVTHIGSEAIYLTIIVSLPAIVTSLLVGIVVALFSATTQIQEQTLSFAPKMIAVYVAILATGTWVGALMVNFTIKCFNEIASITVR